jgi:hypothetical protein
VSWLESVGPTPHEESGLGSPFSPQHPSALKRKAATDGNGLAAQLGTPCFQFCYWRPLYPRKRTSSRALVLTQFTISLASAEYFCDSGSDNVSRRLRIRPQLDTQLATGRVYFSGFGETKSTSLTRSNSCQTWLSQWRT